MAPPPYPSDQEWEILQPRCSPRSKSAAVRRSGRSEAHGGCRLLPAKERLLVADGAQREYPPWQTVYYHFRKWRIDGRLRRAHDRLREAVGEREGRQPDPSTAVR